MVFVRPALSVLVLIGLKINVVVFVPLSLWQIHILSFEGAAYTANTQQDVIHCLKHFPVVVQTQNWFALAFDLFSHLFW